MAVLGRQNRSQCLFTRQTDRQVAHRERSRETKRGCDGHEHNRFDEQNTRWSAVWNQVNRRDTFNLNQIEMRLLKSFVFELKIKGDKKSRRKSDCWKIRYEWNNFKRWFRANKKRAVAREKRAQASHRTKSSIGGIVNVTVEIGEVEKIGWEAEMSDRKLIDEEKRTKGVVINRPNVRMTSTIHLMESEPQARHPIQLARRHVNTANARKRNPRGEQAERDDDLEVEVRKGPVMVWSRRAPNMNVTRHVQRTRTKAKHSLKSKNTKSESTS